MKRLNKRLTVKYNFFGNPRPIDAQSFDTKLKDFRCEAYATLSKEHNNLRARSLVDDAINVIGSLLMRIWHNTDNLAIISQVINVDLLMDNDYTAYYIVVRYSDASPESAPKYETCKSENFDAAMQAEKDEVLLKYGFTEVPPKKYRVKFDNYEAVINELQLRELQKEHPELHIHVVEEPQDDSLDLYDQEQHRAAADARGCK